MKATLACSAFGADESGNPTLCRRYHLTVTNNKLKHRFNHYAKTCLLQLFDELNNGLRSG